MEIFLTAPRGVPDRWLRLQERMRDVRALAGFYEGPDAGRKTLEEFLESGSWRPAPAPIPTPRRSPAAKVSVENPPRPRDNERIRWPGAGEPIAEPPSFSSELREPVANNPRQAATGPADDFDSICSEIQGDLQALDDYLENSVFGASGFEPYWHQELSRVWKMFEHLEESRQLWSAYVRDAYRRGVPAVVAAAPQLGEGDRVDRQVAAGLRRIVDSLATLEGRRSFPGPGIAGPTRPETPNGRESIGELATVSEEPVVSVPDV